MLVISSFVAAPPIKWNFHCHRDWDSLLHAGVVMECASKEW